MHGIEFLRINDNSKLLNVRCILSSDVCNTEFSVVNESGKKYYISTKDAIFYRRGNIFFPKLNNVNQNEIEINKKLDVENKFLESYIFHDFQTRLSDINNNKILNLKLAISVGLNVPKSVVSNSFNDLQCYFGTDELLAIKPISNSHINYIEEETNKIVYSPGTLVLPLSKVSVSDFGISLFQKYIQKKFEVRVFIFNNLIFASAIFSQQNVKLNSITETMIMNVQIE